MRDFLTLGPTPSGESCEQVGEGYDRGHAVAECRTFVRQLQRLWPETSFGVKGFPHDFGTYLEVVVWFDTSEKEEREAAYDVVNATPENWDEEAKADLQGWEQRKGERDGTR